MRLHAESVRFKGTPPWVTKAWTSVSSASALSTAIDFLANIFDTFPFPSSIISVFHIPGHDVLGQARCGNTSPLSGSAGVSNPRITDGSVGSATLINVNDVKGDAAVLALLDEVVNRILLTSPPARQIRKPRWSPQGDFTASRSLRASTPLKPSSG